MLPIVGRVGAEVARFRFTSGASANAWLIDRFGYDTGMFLDKLLAAGVYSIKIAAFALPVGMVLFGVAIAIFMTAEPVGDTAAATSEMNRDDRKPRKPHGISRRSFIKGAGAVAAAAGLVRVRPAAADAKDAARRRRRKARA